MGRAHRNDASAHDLAQSHSLEACTLGAISAAGGEAWCMAVDRSIVCLAALLGTKKHGRFRVAPRSGSPKATRRYRDGTLILEMWFEIPEGAAR